MVSHGYNEEKMKEKEKRIMTRTLRVDTSQKQEKRNGVIEDSESVGV